MKNTKKLAINAQGRSSQFLSFTDVLQALGRNGATGKLLLRDSGTTLHGRIDLFEGQIQKAGCRTDIVESIAYDVSALIALLAVDQTCRTLSWTWSECAVSRSASPVGVESMLFEAARKMDEATK